MTVTIVTYSLCLPVRDFAVRNTHRAANHSLAYHFEPILDIFEKQEAIAGVTGSASHLMLRIPAINPRCKVPNGELCLTLPR